MSDQQSNTLLNRRVLINALTNYVGKIVNLGVWFLLTPFILNSLGTYSYGLWILIGSVAAYGTLLDFGITGTVTKYVAEYLARNEKERVSALISTALVIYVGLGLFVILLSAAFAPFVPRIFNLPADQHSTASWLLLLSGLHVGLSIPATTAPSVLRGLQRFDLMNFTSLFTTIVSSISIVIVLTLTGSVIGLMVTILLSNLLALIPNIWFIHRVAPDIRLNFRMVHRDLFRQIFTFSSSLFLIQIGGRMESQTDEIVIGGFLPITAVTPYSIARKLSTLPQMLTDQFLTLLLPLASQIYALKDMERLRGLFLLSTRLTLAIFIPLGCVITVFASPILSLWVGEEFAAYSYLVIFLTIASLIDTSTWPAGSVIQSMTRHRFTAVMAISSGIINLILSIILVQYIGLVGVAIGTLIPTTIICLGFVIPFTLRLLDIQVKVVLREIYFPALWPAVPMFLVMGMFRMLFAQTSWISVGFAAGTGVLVYAVLYLTNRTNLEERKALHRLAASTLQFAKVYLKVS